MAKSDTEISIWISYEDTLANQNKFLNWVELLEKNKGIVPPHQRKTFFRQLSKATLTVGRGQKVVYKTKEGVRIPMGSLLYFGQIMAYQDKKITKWKYNNRKYDVPIERLWALLKDHLLKVFPYAQNEAIRMSAERFRGQAKPGSVEYFPSTRSFRE